MGIVARQFLCKVGRLLWVIDFIIIIHLNNTSFGVGSPLVIGIVARQCFYKVGRLFWWIDFIIYDTLSDTYFGDIPRYHLLSRLHTLKKMWDISLLRNWYNLVENFSASLLFTSNTKPLQLPAAAHTSATIRRLQPEENKTCRALNLFEAPPPKRNNWQVQMLNLFHWQKKKIFGWQTKECLIWSLFEVLFFRRTIFHFHRGFHAFICFNFTINCPFMTFCMLPNFSVSKKANLPQSHEYAYVHKLDLRMINWQIIHKHVKKFRAKKLKTAVNHRAPIMLIQMHFIEFKEYQKILTASKNHTDTLKQHIRSCVF